MAGTTIGEFEPADGLVGVPWGAVIKILKSDGPAALFDHDAQCRVDEAGYVWLSTPALMQGYFAQRELTDQVVCNDWFLTGDMGFIDGRGWFYLKGRERDEINKGGTKIYPIDIEAVVEKFEYAESVCTFAVADPLYGQNVAMAVVLKRQDAAAIQALHRWMKAHLADFKCPSAGTWSMRCRKILAVRSAAKSCKRCAPICRRWTCRRYCAHRLEFNGSRKQRGLRERFSLSRAAKSCATKS